MVQPPFAAKAIGKPLSLSLCYQEEEQAWQRGRLIFTCRRGPFNIPVEFEPVDRTQCFGHSCGTSFSRSAPEGGTFGRNLIASGSGCG
jgi:hypothetical protein